MVDPLRGFGAQHLEHRRADRRRGAAAGQRRQFDRAQAGDGDLLARQPLGVARLVQPAALLRRIAHHRQMRGQRRGVAPAALEGQQMLGHRPAVVLRAQPPGDGDADIVEEHLVELMVTRQRGDRANGDARRRHGEQQEGDAGLRPALAAGPHQTEHAAGEMGVGRPDLRAVEHIVVAVAHRAQRQRREVGAGAGFGIALAPIDRTGQDARQQRRLLLVRSVVHDHRRHHLQPHRREVGGAGGGAFLGEDVALDIVPARPAMLHRPVGRGPAGLVQDRLPRQRNVRVGEHAGRASPGTGKVGRQPRAQKAADVVADAAGGGGRKRVHGGIMPRPAGGRHLSYPSGGRHASGPRKPWPVAIWIIRARVAAPSLSPALRR